MATFEEEKKILQQLEKTRDVIRRKHSLLRQDKAKFEKAIKKTFKPIVTPLEKLVSISEKKKTDTEAVVKKEKEEEEEESAEDASQSSSSDNDLDNTVVGKSEFETAGSDEEEDVENLEKNYLTLLKQNRKKSLDNLYGVRLTGDKTYTIGSSSIVFKKDTIEVDGTPFTKTAGLLQLLFKKEPDRDVYSANDMLNYRDILVKSNAHLKNYDKNESMRTFKSNKFHRIIKPLFESSGEGFSIPPYKVARPGTQTDYVYWDDPNELVDRLRLLMAEMAAGNSSHVNEIQSIVEELREGGYIY